MSGKRFALLKLGENLFCTRSIIFFFYEDSVGAEIDGGGSVEGGDGGIGACTGKACYERLLHVVHSLSENLAQRGHDVSFRSVCVLTGECRWAERGCACESLRGKE